MSGAILNEHDAHLGAQSKGEFLGMTGNSSWWLLGSAGLAVLMVLGLWGVFGVPLLPCLVAGLGLCALSLVYVFALKNNRPAHYDTDFFESVLVEAGVLEPVFGPRGRRLENPFSGAAAKSHRDEEIAPRFGREPGRGAASAGNCPQKSGLPEPAEAGTPEKPRRKAGEKPAVPLATFEQLQHELSDAQDRLEDALAGQEGDFYEVGAD